MYATAMIEAMARFENISLMVPDEDDYIEASEEQQDVYADFSKTVYQTLLEDVNHHELVHNIIFSAQNDAWATC